MFFTETDGDVHISFEPSMTRCVVSCVEWLCANFFAQNVFLK